MGYDLHITRARRWTDSEDRPITHAEWQAYVSTDPDLRYDKPGMAEWRGHPDGEMVWFYCSDGEIVVKNPDEPTIAKMIAIAGKVGARVVGDDDETYESPGRPPRPATLSLSERLGSWFSRLRPSPKIEPVVLPFSVGDRVRDMFGQEATVVAIDLNAEHGLGVIRVRFDDGRELSYMAVAHDLKPVTGRKGD